ncbi:hypothetical protein N9Z67_02095 [Rhodopirellula sp.]|nr:hypothetical protein [bacterium]MDB4394124.1 hypothetical protein [Rhodopirellula sp.]
MDEKSARDASLGLLRQWVWCGHFGPKSDGGVGCRDPSSRKAFDFCYLWKHWSQNADVKKFNGLLVRNAAISASSRKFAASWYSIPRLRKPWAILHLKSTKPQKQGERQFRFVGDGNSSFAWRVRKTSVLGCKTSAGDLAWGESAVNDSRDRPSSSVFPTEFWPNHPVRHACGGVFFGTVVTFSE